MSYLFVFIEGIASFLSPCVLPLIPVYVTYFAANQSGKKSVAIKNACGFVLGFTLVFVSLGIFSSSLAVYLLSMKKAIRMISGIVLLVFGLKFMGLIHLPWLDKNFQLKADVKNLGFFSSMCFGIIFSCGWTPCIGAYLTSALMLAANSDTVLQGGIMLLLFSLGLGLPFILSAALIEQLGDSFAWIKRHMELIQKISGGCLALFGLAMILNLFMW